MARRPIELTVQSYFSDSYSEARSSFIREVDLLGAQRWSAALPRSEPSDPLTIDVARLGPPDATRALVISSGTHGVEGFFGSAVQLATLKHSLPDIHAQPGLALVLIHAVNPYGFAHLRRVNEDNIDLNRNFLRPGEAFSGADPGYVALNSLLNPTTPPQALDLFWLNWKLYSLSIVIN